MRLRRWHCSAARPFLPLHWGTFQPCEAPWDIPSKLCLKCALRRRSTRYASDLGGARGAGAGVNRQPWWRAFYSPPTILSWHSFGDRCRNRCPGRHRLWLEAVRLQSDDQPARC